MSDMLSAISTYISGVDSVMGSVPDAMAANAPSGDFETVFANIQRALGQPVPAAPPSTTSPSAELSASTGGLAGSLLPSGAQVSGAQAPTATATAMATNATANSVVNEAEQFLGTPYVWGGTSPQGFDCSGFAQYVYGQLGLQLPRTSEEQALQGTAVPDIASAQPGDLVFFAGSDGTASAPGHVGIYIGNGQMIDAPETGENVQIQPVGDPVAIRRVLPDNSATLTASTDPVSAGAPTAAPSPAALQSLFTSASSRYGLPSGLLPAIASVESGDQTTSTSSAGAEGIMQLMPGTAASLGDNPFDPAQAIDGAAQLLSGYLKQFGSLPLAIAAYNAGPATVTSYGGMPPYAQTQTYVQQVLGQMGTAS